MIETALSFTHRFVPGADPGRVPMLLLHGTGGDESDLVPLGEAVAPRAALLSPRGKVLERGMLPGAFVADTGPSKTADSVGLEAVVKF